MLYLPVEIKPRELPGRLLLACCAAESGFAVVIGNQVEMDRYCRFFPPGMLLEKDISTRRWQNIRPLFNKGFSIASIDEEAGGFFSMPQFIDARYDGELLSSAAKTFFWSQMHLELVQARFPEVVMQTSVVGNPRFDVCRPELRGVFTAASQDIRQRFGDFILLMSNFSYSNYVLGEEKLLSEAKRSGKYKNDAERDTYLGRVTHKKNNMAAFIDALPEIRKAFPNLSIVIRPHPVERIETWREIGNTIENCHVVYEGDANSWLLAAKAIFHHGCTTGLEAFLLGRASVSFHPHPHETYDAEPSAKVSLVAGNQAQLIVQLRSIVDGSGVLPPMAIAENFVRIGEEYAADRIVADLTKQPIGQQHLDVSFRNTGLWKRRVVQKMREARAVTVGWRKNRVNRGRWKQQKFSGTTLAEIRQLMGSMREETGRFDGIVANKILRDVYLLKHQ